MYKRQILWSQINRVITTNDYDVKQENQNLQSDVIELKESKEKTLLDDFDIQEVPIKKETSNSKKKNTIKYEKITLEAVSYTHLLFLHSSLDCYDTLVIGD